MTYVPPAYVTTDVGKALLSIVNPIVNAFSAIKDFFESIAKSIAGAFAKVRDFFAAIVDYVKIAWPDFVGAVVGTEVGYRIFKAYSKKGLFGSLVGLAFGNLAGLFAYLTTAVTLRYLEKRLRTKGKSLTAFPLVISASDYASISDSISIYVAPGAYASDFASTLDSLAAELLPGAGPFDLSMASDSITFLAGDSLLLSDVSRSIDLASLLLGLLTQSSDGALASDSLLVELTEFAKVGPSDLTAAVDALLATFPDYSAYLYNALTIPSNGSSTSLLSNAVSLPSSGSSTAALSNAIVLTESQA